MLPRRQRSRSLQERHGTLASKFVKLAHQMRLIGVAALDGEFRPIRTSCSLRDGKRPIKANHAGDGFWADADLLVEARDQMFSTPVERVCDPADANIALAAQDALVSPGDRRAANSISPEPPAHELLDQAKSLPHDAAIMSGIGGKAEVRDLRLKRC